MFFRNIVHGMTQFNQIYINNIVDGLNDMVIDATSITPAVSATGTISIKQTLKSLLKNQDNPYFILNGPCEWFESWSDSRINFSGQTVDFFLYEVLHVWNNNKRWDCPEGVINEDCVINEFEMVDRWCKKHNCSYRIFVNEFNMLQSLQNTKYANRAIQHLDTFSLAYYTNIKDADTTNLKHNISYKLNCFTYRWDQIRMLASAWLTGRNDCIVTHYHKTAGVKYKWPIKDSIHWQKLINKRNLLQCIGPLALEKHLTEKFDPAEHVLPVTKEHLTTDSIEDYYLKSFASLVCETNYEYPWGQLSEKTINAIRFENAFILLAGPGSLEQAKSWGFKTFNQWWDESYDTIINPCQRMDAVLNIVDTILNYTYDELQEIKKQMAPTLLHNRNIIRTGELRQNIMKEII